MTFDIYDDENSEERVLYLYDATQEEFDNVQADLDNLVSSVIDYLDGDDENLIEYIYYAAYSLENSLGATINATQYLRICVEGWEEFPIVWMTSDTSSSEDLAWAVVYGDIVSENPDCPVLWSWEKSNGSATDDETKAAYEVMSEGIDGIDLSELCKFHHNVWNDLVTKVFETRSYHGSSWYTEDNVGNVYLSYEDTLMGDCEEERELTAEKFNAVRFNVGMSESTGINPEDIQRGKPIKGEYFLLLTEALNRFIEQ